MRTARGQLIASLCGARTVVLQAHGQSEPEGRTGSGCLVPAP